MSEELSGQQFFELNGYYPTTFREPKPSLSRSTTKARGAYQASRALALRGRSLPLHWTVPPAFENPGLVYETLGHEAYCEQVRSYYETIRDAKVEQAQAWHVRWAIRACLRTFETHVRGFRGQSVGKRGGIFGKSSGQEKYGSGSRATYQDILVLPETLIEDGRLVADLKGYLRAYGVPEQQWAVAERLVRSRLSKAWGVKA